MGQRLVGFFLDAYILGPRWALAGEIQTLARFGSPNPQTHEVKTGPSLALAGFETRGFQVHTRPATIFMFDFDFEGPNSIQHFPNCIALIQSINFNFLSWNHTSLYRKKRRTWHVKTVASMDIQHFKSF
jgi:hypothetical protein